MIRAGLTLLLLLLVGLLASGAVQVRAATTWRSGFTEEIVVEGLDKPTAIAWAPDGRIFVAEKDGRVRIVSAAGQLLSAPFATLSVTTLDDLGLIGITLDPDFVNQPYVYLAYTTRIVPRRPATAYSKIHRITRMTADGNVAVPGSELILVDDIPSDHTSHVGGALRFGPDGKLYATIGDGSSYLSVDPLALRALDVDSLNGKVLRINADGSAPTDNPFYTTPGAIRSKVWQTGLRNPFKATFRPGTGKLYINDVGWGNREEIDVGPPGAGFGWPCFEGNPPEPQYTAMFPTACGAAPSRQPLYSYLHDANSGAITGGAFYEGANYPAPYVGKYFISDYAQRWIRYLDLTPDDQVVSVEGLAVGDPSSFHPVDLTLGPDGNLYYVNIATDFALPSGTIGRIVYVGGGNHSPRAVASASPTAGYAPLAVTFSAAGTTDDDTGDVLSYHWIFGDGAASADGLEAGHTYPSDGIYLAKLQVSDGTAVAEDHVIITVGSLPPTAVILDPPAWSTFETGETLTYSGSATDPDEGALEPAALHWTVIQHHNTHEHLYHHSMGTSGSFTAEGHGATGDTIYYELVLEATDSSGLSDVRRLEIHENQSPAAEGGGDRTVDCVLPAPLVVLDARQSSDPDNQPVAYAWTQTAGPGVVLEGADTATPSFTAPISAGGTVLRFRLEVNDGHVSSYDDVAVTVPDLSDLDLDTDPACSDCVPTDPRWVSAGPTDGLVFAADGVTLSWNPAPRATAYDLLRGALLAPFAYNHACVQTGLPAPWATDTELRPQPGAGFYYLSRGSASCGPGSAGAASDGTPLPNPVCP